MRIVPSARGVVAIALSTVAAAPLVVAACSSTPAAPVGPDAGPAGEASAPVPTADAVADDDPGPCPGPRFEGAPLGVRCGDLVDREGRSVLLHGVNARVAGVFDVTFDDGRKALEPIPAFTADDARRLRALGLPSLRLPIHWSAIEPKEDGGIDGAYFDRVAAVVDLCAQAGVSVLLDLHQDAYSKEIGEDGAPLWAIVPPPTKLLEGPLEDLAARRLSQQVLDAFATFFGASADGARLRGRFATMAAAVARRFADHDGVVGLELFNEPLATEEEVARFHAEVFPAVRAAAPKKLVLFEPTVYRNFTDEVTPGTGSLGAGTAYAPHVYTYSFDEGGDDAGVFDVEALRPSNKSARREADGWQAPLVITEYGFDPRRTGYRSYLHAQHALQDEYRASAYYWVWREESQGSWGFFDADDGGVRERAGVVDATAWVRLEAAAGRLRSVRYDPAARRFEARYVGRSAVTAPSLVSLGATLGFASFEATCDGRAVTVPRTEPLAIPCAGPGEHVITVEAR